MNGVIPELSNLDLDDFLADVPAGAQKAWVRAYGLPLVREELPYCWAAWESDVQRQQSGPPKAVYIRHWLHNRKDEMKNAPMKSFGSYDVISREGQINQIDRKLNQQELNSNPPDPEKVKQLIRSVTGNIGRKND